MPECARYQSFLMHSLDEFDAVRRFWHQARLTVFTEAVQLLTLHSVMAGHRQSRFLGSVLKQIQDGRVLHKYPCPYALECIALMLCLGARRH